MKFLNLSLYYCLFLFYRVWNEEGVKTILKEKARQNEGNVLRFSDCCEPYKCSKRSAASFFNTLLSKFNIHIKLEQNFN